MKNKPFIFIGLIIFFLIILLNFNTFQLATDELLKKIIHIKDKNYTLFIVIICFLNFFYFLTPIPTLPLLVLNGFLIQNYGFFLSYFMILICSSIIFSKSKIFIGFLQKFNFYKTLSSKINNNKNNDFNFYIVASSRFLLPYFFHNVFFGSILKNRNVFILSIVLAEIPIVFIINKFGKYLRDFSDLNSYNFNDILNINFILFFLVFFLLVFIISRFSKYVKSKIK